MGTWSHESFGNDDACDFASEVAESADLSIVERALDTVLNTGDEYLEAPEASQAIAAAEAVARLRGNFGKQDSYSEQIDSWAMRLKLTPSASIVLKAQQAINRVLTDPSELKDLWEESEDHTLWLAAIEELRTRVRV